jgi:hypothetical protein
MATGYASEPPGEQVHPGHESCYLTAMRYLHTMIRVRDLRAALRFFCEGLGLQEVRRRDSEQGRYTLVFLGEKPKDCRRSIDLQPIV